MAHRLLAFMRLLSGRALCYYALAQGAILLGAWLMHATASVLPMALCAAAGLMLTAAAARAILRSERGA